MRPKVLTKHIGTTPGVISGQEWSQDGMIQPKLQAAWGREGWLGAPHTHRKTRRHPLDADQAWPAQIRLRCAPGQAPLIPKPILAG